MFVEGAEWEAPWAGRSLPVIGRPCEERSDRACFTRFLPAAAVGKPGAVAKDLGRRFATVILVARSIEMGRPAASDVPLRRQHPSGGASPSGDIGANGS